MLYSGPPLLPLKIAASHWKSYVVPWAHPSQIPNGITIDSAAFAGFTVVTDGQTDRPRYSVCSSRPHLASAAVRPDDN